MNQASTTQMATPARTSRFWPAGLRFGGDVNTGDRVFRLVTATFAGLSVLILIAMAVQMLRASGMSIGHFGSSFVVGSDWDPVRDHYGALPFVYGTVVSSLLSLLFAI